MTARIPPHDLTAEGAVLSACMLSQEALDAARDVVNPAHFYADAHRRVAEAIWALDDAGAPVDVVAVASRLSDAGRLQQVGGMAYLAELIDATPAVANVAHHAALVRGKARLRAVIAECQLRAAEGYGEVEDVEAWCDQVEAGVFAASQRDADPEGPSRIDELVTGVVADATQRQQQGAPPGPSWGWRDLDRKIGKPKPYVYVVAGRPGMGKCFAPGTRVLMFDGSTRPVEEIAAGDMVMGPDSKARRVLETHSGYDEMFAVRQNKACAYVVNSAHLLHLKKSRRTEGAGERGSTINVSVGEYLERSQKFRSNYKGYKVAVDYPRRDVPLEPYFLGVWLGDGHSDRPFVTSADPEIVAELERFAERMGVRCVGKDPRGEARHYYLGNGCTGGGPNPVIEALRAAGVLADKHVPLAYLANDRETRLEVLAGLLDTDGHYQPAENLYRITQKRRGLAEDIARLAESLGFRATHSSKVATCNGREICDVFTITISGAIDAIPVRVSRKKARPTRMKCDPLVTGITVTPVGRGPYHGFEVDGDHLFLLADGTVVHNSALAQGIAVNMAKQGLAAGFISLEMLAEQITERAVVCEGKVDAKRLRAGKLNPEDFKRFIDAAAQVGKLPLQIRYRPGATVSQIRAAARKLFRELEKSHGAKPGVLVIDYLQLIDDQREKGETRDQAIGRITRALVRLAGEIGVPVILLSQLNREVEKRPNKRPVMSDLRESGNIEQEAHAILFLYRDDYYYPDSEDRGLAEVVVGKDRNGGSGWIKLKFTGEYTRFDSLAPADIPDGYEDDFDTMGAST